MHRVNALLQGRLPEMFFFGTSPQLPGSIQIWIHAIMLLLRSDRLSAVNFAACGYKAGASDAGNFAFDAIFVGVGDRNSELKFHGFWTWNYNSITNNSILIVNNS